MDIFRMLFKRQPLILIPVLLIFYFFRTAPVDLSKEKEIHNLMTRELKTKYLSTKALDNLSQADKQEIENNEIVITSIKGKYSAASFLTTTLFLKVTFHTTLDSSSKTLNYKIYYDVVARRWIIRMREIMEMSWKVAI